MYELLILSRAVHFGSCMVLLSVFAVRLLVERPAAKDPPPAAAGWLAGVCLAVAAGSGFLWLWASVAGMSGSSLRDSLDLQLFKLVIEQTPPGRVWVVRCGIGLLLGVALCFARWRWTWLVAAVLAAAFTGSISWLGHAGASEEGRRSVMLAADVTHLLAVSAWPAGLLPFALLLRRQMKAGALAAAYTAARRFSAMSLVAVAVIAASGFVNAYFLVGSFHGLVGTDYGRLLMVKLALFAAAAILGAWNLLVHEPRIETDPGALGAMRRKVWVEVGLGTLIVGVVAVMGTLPPGSSPGG
jgi:putative copper resistance protein D